MLTDSLVTYGRLLKPPIALNRKTGIAHFTTLESKTPASISRKRTTNNYIGDLIFLFKYKRENGDRSTWVVKVTFRGLKTWIFWGFPDLAPELFWLSSRPKMAFVARKSVNNGDMNAC